jgi:hypothetical protein
MSGFKKAPDDELILCYMRVSICPTARVGQAGWWGGEDH